MQTFLPYADFKKSAACLDNRRLNKQILEAKTIYDIITGNSTSEAWIHHPAVLMWKGYQDALALYYNACLDEWKINRKKNHSYEKIHITDESHVKIPPWLGDERFHSSHRSNLLRKDEWYDQFGWKESWDLPYFWPV